MVCFLLKPVYVFYLADFVYIPEKIKQFSHPVESHDELDLVHHHVVDYLSALSVIKQLSLLARAIQKHRGLSMSILAGYRQFRPELDRLQQQVTRRMLVLETFSAHMKIENQYHRMQESWQTIASNWQHDSVMENFEFHSYFIEQIFEVMVGITKQLTLPFLGKIIPDDYENNASLANQGHRAFHLFSVINFCCQQMPVFTELLAKVRGLGTYTLNCAVEDDIVKSKLNYFLQSARSQHDVLYSSIEQYSKTSNNLLISATEMSKNEDKLRYIFSVLNKELISEEENDVNSRQLFDMVTEVIDVYWQVVDQGLTIMAKWQEDALDQWFCEH